MLNKNLLLGSWTGTIDGQAMTINFSSPTEFTIEFRFLGKTVPITGNWEWRQDTPHLYKMKSSNLVIKTLMKKDSPLPIKELTESGLTIEFMGKTATLARKI